MKLWDKGFDIDSWIESYTVGNDQQLDLQLASYDIEASLAHIKMLESIGLLTHDEFDILQQGLNQIAKEIDEGSFQIEEGIEDIHSEVEHLLTQRLGEVGKKIHSGRSRNDQVLVDLKLFYRAEMKKIATDIYALFNRLQILSNRYKNILMPGYTHMQIAMPSSFGLWFGAYAETLIDDMRLVATAYSIANQNPLGSAAGYGSSFPLNRTMTTKLLKFNDLHYNVVAASMSRGKTEQAIGYAINSVATTLGKLAMDICLFNSQNYSFISFPDAYTTGSSIMPHKKNPDVWEIMRSRCNLLRGVQNDIALTITNLPLGYHRDLQILKNITFPAIANLKESLKMADFMLQHILVNQEAINDERYNYLFTVEDVNRLTLSGVPFREAYKIIGQQVQEGSYIPNKEINHTHEGSIGNLCNDAIAQKMKSVFDIFDVK